MNLIQNLLEPNKPLGGRTMGRLLKEGLLGVVFALLVILGDFFLGLGISAEKVVLLLFFAPLLILSLTEMQKFFKKTY